ncbi:MAG: PhoPQ-activated protein PqaA family protein [Oligoflexales bacterium]
MTFKIKFIAFTFYFYSAVAFASGKRILLDYIKAFEKETKVLGSSLISDKGEYKLYNISFNSLKWMDGTELNKPIWHHNILIIIPKKVDSDTCFYRISNGKRNEKVPQNIHPVVEHVSLKNNAIGIEIRNVPNQPIKFKDSKQPLKEDAIIAYGWDKYLKSRDMKYIPRLPMLKAAYLGFRVAKNFLKEKNIVINDYVAYGESKRGWVVWLLPVVDTAVKAIIPAVIDVLNVQKSMKHHLKIYGNWSPVLKDYEKFNIPKRMFGKEFASLMELIDPYKYRRQLKVPKFIINSGNDQFFLPDSSQFYFKDLIGENRIMFLPNAGHQFKFSQIQLNSLATYFSLIDDSKAIPEISWEKVGETINIWSNTDISELRVWQAANAKARDFRHWDENSPQYKETKISTRANKKKYEIKLYRQKDQMHTSTFIEALFSLQEGNISFTTEAFVN